jgi:CDI immunity proteins
MKLENNWRQKTIENLEKNNWGEPTYGSYLVTRCHELRKMPLENFTTEDLRIMIGQQIGLDFLIPLAIETLTKDLFAEGDFFEGDLLKNVLTIDIVFWHQNEKYWNEINELIKDRKQELSKNKIDFSIFLNAIN